MRRLTHHRIGAAVLVAGLLPLIAPVAGASADGHPPDPLAGLAIPDGPVVVDASLSAVTGPVQVVVQLARAPLSKAVGQGAKQTGASLSKKQQQDYVKLIGADQDTFVASASRLGAVQNARVSISLNAVVVTIDASQIRQLSAISGVSSVRAVGDYQLDLADTVPYIGATAMRTGGFDGSGVRVAVLDSGVDFTHAALGGPGTTAAYLACFAGAAAAPTGDCANYFGAGAPKVKGGYDFVGEAWPNANLAPDPNPIDQQGHGTHVADIIAGTLGVAPGADLYAVKVCSAVATSCSGVALLEGIDFSLDPNGDGSIDDAVDVINMSLGSSYGQIQDDLSFASANAVALGVTVVASAGNSADRPYILGSPSSTPGVISVAQTQVPSASAVPLVINSPAAIAGVYGNTATVEWAPIGAGFTGDVVYAGSVGSPLACAPYPAGAFAGKVALVDRGTCAVSVKVDNAANAGAIGVLVALNAAGDAVSFSFGGGSNFVPTLVITRSTGLAIRNTLIAGTPVNVTVSPASSIPLVGSVVGSSSRGPSYSFDAIKPDIAAPGASLSAVVGTGTGTTAFGGTSGAAPMVSGAAALLIDKFGPVAPRIVKARLMGSAETNITTNPATQPGVLAPITRIGGGEVRVDKAAALTTTAWADGDDSANAASLSFGFLDVSAPTTITKRLIVSNFGTSDVTYTLTPTFRYADDAASGAVTVSAPSTVRVKKGDSKTVTVSVRIDPTKLPAWNLDSGAVQGDGSLLQNFEFDGYLKITAGTQLVTVPWHVLPRQAAAVTAPAALTLTAGSGTVTFANTGAAGDIGLYALDGVDPKDYPKPLQGGPGDNFTTPDIKAVGSRYLSSGGGTLQFAVNYWNEWSHPAYPNETDVYIDADLDGVDDFVLFNGELSGFAVTGQSVVNVYNLRTGQISAYYYLIADLNGSNMIMTAPAAAVGVSANTQFAYHVEVADNYFTGAVTDVAGPFTVTGSTPKYTTSAVELGVPAGASTSVTVTATANGAAASPTQVGVLAVYSPSLAKASVTEIFVTP